MEVITSNIIEVDPYNPEIEKENTANSNEGNGKSYNPNDVDISSKRLSLEFLLDKIRNGEINLHTGFQRKPNLWDKTKQSRFIESILIRLPLPVFYFDGTEEDNWLVIDGLQRLGTLSNFIIDKSFCLQNLEYLHQFNGNKYGFEVLPRDLQRRIFETEVPVYIINPGTPPSVKFSIFHRINTGGLTLKPQEIRHALNQGVPANFIQELADSNEFKVATGGLVKQERMEDREFITRFVAFYLIGYENYEPDLESFLNSAMIELNDINQNQRDEIRYHFFQAMIAANKIFGDDAFRKRFDIKDAKKPINKALFESWSVNLAKLVNDEINELIQYKEKLKNFFIETMNIDVNFVKSISSGTGDKRNVNKRFSTIQKIIQKVTK